MKKILFAACALLCVATIAVQAQEAGEKKAKKELTAEQKQLQTTMLAKYDTSKDGKLDKTERAAMSQEDKDAWAKAFPAKKKQAGEEAAPKAADKK